MNKPFYQLNPLDQQLRRSFPTRPVIGTRVKIELISGYELFNTRAHHNYEDWSDGYRVSLPDGSLAIEKEDLDDAILAFCKLYEENRARTATTRSQP